MIKYTKEQLQAMSDFEVNKALAVLLGFKLSNWLNNNYGHYEVEGTSLISPVRNYCNTPNDIMPLAFEHGISLIKLDSAWAATNNPAAYITDSIYRFNKVGGVSDWNENPLRTITCCLIMVLQEKWNG